MNILIRPATNEDLAQRTRLYQHVYETVLVNPDLGITKDLFSKEVFNTKDTQDYLRSINENNENQKAWVATIGDEIVGAITVRKVEDEYEILGFYVAVEHHGKGIGKQLWNKAMEFVNGQGDIIIDIYAHNTKSIEMYKKWGFEIVTTKGENGYFDRHWDEWPADTKIRSVYMRKKFLDLKKTY